MRKNITLLSHRLIRGATVTREAKKQMISLKHHLTCKLFQVRRANHQGKQRCPYLSKSYVQVALRVRGRRINIWQNCVRGGNSEGWAHWHSGCGHSSPFSVCGNFRCNIPASSVWCFQCVNSEHFQWATVWTFSNAWTSNSSGSVQWWWWWWCGHFLAIHKVFQFHSHSHHARCCRHSWDPCESVERERSSPGDSDPQKTERKK